MIISVPLGGYAPTFSYRDEAPSASDLEADGAGDVEIEHKASTARSQISGRALVGIATVIVLVIGAAIIGFRFAGTPSEVPDLQRSILAEFSGPRLAVGNFQSDQQNEGLAQGLKVDIQAELLRFDWLGVYVSSFGDGDEWTQTDVHYLLNGSIRTSASGSVFVLKLVGPKSGQFFGSTAMILATVQNAWSKLSRTRQ